MLLLNIENVKKINLNEAIQIKGRLMNIEKEKKIDETVLP